MEKKQSKREINKTQNRAAIMDAAEALFLSKGFESTSIDDVAKASGFTKRTLYQYFTGKDDLVYAVVLQGARLLTDAYELAFHSGKGALEKIRLANDAFLQFYMNHQGLFRLMNSLPPNPQGCEQSDHYRELVQLDALRMMHFSNLVEQAKQDGSLNPDLDARKAVFFDFFASFSLLNMLSTMQGAWDMLQLDEHEFIRFCFDMLTDAIKPRDNGGKA